MSLKLRRGTSDILSTIIPAEGELVYATDTKRLFVGDGVTVGGNSVDLGSVGAATFINADGVFEPNVAGTGFTGSRGDKGYTGSEGRPGYTGSLGRPGFTGSGGRGFTGSAGAGFTGSAGAGFTGSRGFTGSAGAGGTLVFRNESNSVNATPNTIIFSGEGVGLSRITSNGANTLVVGVGATAVKVYKDSSLVTTSANKITFTGGGVTVSPTNNTDITVNIPGGGSGGSSSSLTNGNKVVALGTDGSLTFPSNSITQPTATTLSIKTDSGPLFFATVITPGTGFTNATVIATTTGGNGTGLTVRVTRSGTGAGGVTVVSPGVGYQNNDLLTLVPGSGIGIGTGCTIRLNIVMSLYNWKFGATGITTFPGMVDFPIRSDIVDYQCNALVFNTRKPVDDSYIGYTALITTDPGTQTSPDSQDLFISGGVPYSDVSGDAGSVTVAGGTGYFGGALYLQSGRGTIGGPIQMIAGSGQVTRDQRWLRGIGGDVTIGGGYGMITAGNVTIAGGEAGAVGSDTASAGNVTIQGGSGSNATNRDSGGHVFIRAGVAKAGGISGKVQIKTDPSPQSGDEHIWEFSTNGRFSIPIDTAPAHSYGAAGDKAGMIAVSSDWLYYCTDNYVDNTTNIWKRVALNGTAW